MFEAPLFQNVLPAVKLKHYEDMTQSFLKQGMGKQEAGRAAAEFTNNLYGGINWEAMGRSRDFQNLGRMAILAPDWLETNVRMGAGTAKAANPKNLLNPKTPQGRAYRKAIFGLMGTYAAANAVNFALSGKPMWDNAPGHSLDIDLGETASGKKRWIRPWGTSADFLRLPMDMGAAALRQGDYGHWEPDFGSASRTAKNRLSIPAATGINLLTGRDDFGRPLFGEDDYGRPISAAEQGAGVALELGDLIMPPYLRSPIDYGLGKVGGEEAVMGSIESPLRYSAPETTPSGGRGRSRTRPTRGR
jgi:hypothetical protein